MPFLSHILLILIENLGKDLTADRFEMAVLDEIFDVFIMFYSQLQYTNKSAMTMATVVTLSRKY